jgi:D-arginine dehydrogenase
MIRADIAVIGGGIAGASVAAELAVHADVLLLEAEDHPGVHATGRSAAFWSETYGGPGVQPLTSASGPFLRTPPADFADDGLLRPRGAVHLARSAAGGRLDALLDSFADSAVRLSRLPAADVRRVLPGVRFDWANGVAEPDCSDIEVAALHAAYLTAFKRKGGRVLTGARLRRTDRGAMGWRIAASGHAIACTTLVNAAGAWADDVARIAGVRPLGIRPYRRTVVQLRVDPPAPTDLPLVIDIEGGFYFKGESGGRIWLSPHDETPCAAGDVAAEELDVARAIDRLQQVVDWRVERVERSWAGLRSFAPDRLPVYGFDRDVPGLFWCAGQGGFGIQTAPAAARLAAALLLGAAPDAGVAHIDPMAYAPGRFG